MRAPGGPGGRPLRMPRRLVRSALAPLPAAAAGALVIVALADGWRLMLLAAVVAAAVAATRLRFSAGVALGLLLVVSLLAIGGWGPGFDWRPVAAPAHLAHAHRARS
ncbi:MAG: hypothetical protein JSS97_06980 [Actinobacteria bacterium]|nr:hypothetical protein [Actinomycetota bacterium]